MTNESIEARTKQVREVDPELELSADQIAAMKQFERQQNLQLVAVKEFVEGLYGLGD